MMRAILIPVRGPLSVLHFTDDHLDIAEALHVEPGYVDSMSLGQALVLAFGEEIPAAIPINVRATALASLAGSSDIIRGPAAYLWEGETERGINWVSITDVDREMQSLYGQFIVHGVDQHDAPNVEAFDSVLSEANTLLAAAKILRDQPSSVSHHTAEILVAMATRASQIADASPRFSGTAEVVANNIPGFADALSLAEAVLREHS